MYKNDVAANDYIFLVRSFSFQNNEFIDMRKPETMKLNFLLVEHIYNLGGNKITTSKPDKMVYYTGNSTFTDFKLGNSDQN
jgi:hypothetical protein